MWLLGCHASTVRLRPLRVAASRARATIRHTERARSWRTDHRGQKLARTSWTGQVQRDRSTIWADADRERQKPAALTLGVDRPSDHAKNLFICGETKSKPIGQLHLFDRATHEVIEQIFAAGFQSLRAERARNREVCHSFIMTSLARFVRARGGLCAQPCGSSAQSALRRVCVF